MQAFERRVAEEDLREVHPHIEEDDVVARADGRHVPADLLVPPDRRDFYLHRITQRRTGVSVADAEPDARGRRALDPPDAGADASARGTTPAPKNGGDSAVRPEWKGICARA
ncbi:hypothetical protein GCM10009037_09500 [Halarchaeum grantii]|uniref:Uncharacterized protein n=1 Tax=Halarchaeum grantii TaxID=1193105 RepID=A0A830F0E4_9EURY|nr:hypothetical protein GCM10009037_09500 [Halarchaeum grantii]